MICPKCGYQRLSSDDISIPPNQCPKCAIFYSKYIARQTQTNNPQKLNQSKPSIILSKKVLIPLGTLMVIGIISSIWQALEPNKKPIPIKKNHTINRQKNITKTITNERGTSSPIFDLDSLKQRCADDAACIGRDLVLARVPGCQQFIEKQARYRYKWTDGFLSSPFKLFLWIDNEHSAIRAIGDQLEFQNAFGAWQNHTYRCDMKVSDGQVINIIVQPGRL